MRVVVEDIIRIAHLLLVGHAGQLHLVQPVLALRPACVDEHRVDVDLAGLVFAQVEGLGGVGRLLGLTTGGELLTQGGVLGHELLQLDLGGVVRHGHGGGLNIQQGGFKFAGLVGIGVAIGDKVQENIEVLQAQHGLLVGDIAAVVGGLIAQQADELHALPHVRAHHIAEVLVVHQGGEAVIVGQHKGAVHGVHPFDGEFHCAAAVDDRSRRVDGEDFLRSHGHRREDANAGVDRRWAKLDMGVTSVC